MKKYSYEDKFKSKMDEKEIDEIRQRFKQKLEHLPQKPGVYMMQDSLGNIIYVGKAKNLKKRVSQYFNKQKDRAPKIYELVSNIHTFDYLVTDTELDAFIEECRHIKELKPRYNSQMKNDGKYVYIKIPDEQYPILSTTSEKEDGNAIYFGPFTNIYKVESAIEYLNDLFLLRKCTIFGLKKRLSGCTFRQLGTCIGPCTGNVSQDEYNVRIEKVKQFLNGKETTVAEKLHEKMNNAIKEMEFEKAAKYWNYYLGLKHVIGRQKLVLESSKNRNILAVEIIDSTFAKLYFIKGNMLTHKELVSIEDVGKPEFIEHLKQLISNRFAVKEAEALTLTQQNIDEAQIIYSYLKKNKKKILCYWIPSSWLNADAEATAAIEATIQKVIKGIKHSPSDIVDAHS